MIDTNSYYNQQEKQVKDIQSTPVEQPEVETQVEEPQVEEIEQEVPEEQQQQAQETSQAKNFRALRESKERIEREHQEVLRRMQSMEEQLRQKQAPPEQDEDWGVKPDDIVEGKHLTKVSRELKQLKSEIENYKRQSAQSLERSRLTSQFNDFDQVVTKENLDMLREVEPEVYQMLNSSQDVYATGVSAYKMIKKLGIVPEEASYMANKIAAQKNSAKPKPLASVASGGSKSPLSGANMFSNGLTPELQKQLLKEMNEAIKNR